MRDNLFDVKVIFRNNSIFLIPYLIFIFLGGVLLFANSKADTHLEFNTFHSTFFDFFFYYITFLGDGVAALLVVVMLMAVKFRYAFIVGISNIIASLITQLLKHTLFEDMVRPRKFFEGIHDLYLVPGVENYLYNSFPSGHSTCAFALYFALSIIVENKILKSLFFATALLVGISRVYLSQHFFEDIYAGSIIGVLITLAVYLISTKINKNWMENSLVSRKKVQ